MFNRIGHLTLKRKLIASIVLTSSIVLLIAYATIIFLFLISDGGRAMFLRQVFPGSLAIGTVAVPHLPLEWAGHRHWFLIAFAPTALVSLLYSFLLALKLQAIITRPIRELAGDMKKIAATGDYSHRSRQEAADEIGEVAATFNELLADLQRRTAELSAANRALQAEVEERKAIERDLAEETDRLFVTLGSIHEGIITTDGNGSILLMNEAAERITGWRCGEVVGRPSRDVLRVFHEETGEPLENPVEAVLKTGIAIVPSRVVRFEAMSGTSLSVVKSCAPVRDKEGKTIGTVLVLQDITKRLKREREMTNAHKLESVGILAGGIAHDFNNLLMGMIGNVSLAKLDVAEESEAYVRLEQVEKVALRAKDLTQRLLTFSKGGAPVKKTVAVEDLITSSCSFVLSGSPARCRFSITPGLWPVEIDAEQINQVLVDLIINADQAMPTGGKIYVAAENITVGPETELPLTAGKYIRVSVQDQGCGISKKDQEHIFEPYFTTKGLGTGLGLATVHSIIKQHHGHIAVDSKTGFGATFTFYLPALPEDVVPQQEGKGGEEPAFFGARRVLVMDDEAVIQEIARAMLIKLGHEVEIAANGAEAVSMYKEALAANRPFDAVLMDLTIPSGMGGQEAIRHLCAMDPDVRAIVSSGYSDDPVIANHRAHGFRGVIKKPYDLNILSSTLRTVLAEGGPPTRPMALSAPLPIAAKSLN